MRVGLISDTHGLLRSEALEALEGADLVLHAGDVGATEVLDQLGILGQVLAVRGNVDRAVALSRLPARRILCLEGWRVLLVHDRSAVSAAEASAVDVVVSGHSHKPVVIPGEPLWVNPGSAGPRRFRLPVSVGWLDLSGPAPRAMLQTLAVPGSRTRVRTGFP